MSLIDAAISYKFAHKNLLSSLLEMAEQAKTHVLYPVSPEQAQDLIEVLDNLAKHIAPNGQKFTYTYDDESVSVTLGFKQDLRWSDARVSDWVHAHSSNLVNSYVVSSIVSNDSPQLEKALRTLLGTNYGSEAYELPYLAVAHRLVFRKLIEKQSDLNQYIAAEKPKKPRSKKLNSFANPHYIIHQGETYFFQTGKHKALFQKLVKLKRAQLDLFLNKFERPALCTAPIPWASYSFITSTLPISESDFDSFDIFLETTTKESTDV